MIVVEYHDIELDYCQFCHGSWFDRGELDLLLRSMELENSIDLLERLLHQPQAETGENKRKCPECHRRMQKHNLGYSPEILVDLCPNDHGIWFDREDILSLVTSQKHDVRSEYCSEQELISFLGEFFEAEGNT